MSLKKGDLVRYHKKEMYISEEGMPTWIERITTGVVVKNPFDPKYPEVVNDPEPICVLIFPEPFVLTPTN